MHNNRPIAIPHLAGWAEVGLSSGAARRAIEQTSFLSAAFNRLKNNP
jgi:hypothetical protein